MQTQKIQVIDPKKKGKGVALVNSLPKNLEDECERFFESGFTTNPVFKYENPKLAEKFRMQFLKPHDEYMEIAKKIIDSFMEEYGSETNWLER